MKDIGNTIEKFIRNREEIYRNLYSCKKHLLLHLFNRRFSPQNFCFLMSYPFWPKLPLITSASILSILFFKVNFFNKFVVSNQVIHNSDRCRYLEHQKVMAVVKVIYITSIICGFIPSLKPPDGTVNFMDSKIQDFYFTFPFSW